MYITGVGFAHIRGFRKLDLDLTGNSQSAGE
jgi:hypothetical protein